MIPAPAAYKADALTNDELVSSKLSKIHLLNPCESLATLQLYDFHLKK